MSDTTELPATRIAAHTDVQLAAAGYLARYTGHTRDSYTTDLKIFFAWCAANGLEPFAARRPHIELFVRWLDEVRQLKPASVSRRLSTVVGFYRFAAIDDWIPASPAEYVRRPKVPFESARLGLTHLQFEAMIVASRGRPDDEALIMLIGLLGLRVSEACSTSIEDLGFVHGHRTLKVRGKGGRIDVVPLPPAVGRALELATAGRDIGPILRTRRGTRMDRSAATRAVKRIALAAGVHSTMSPHVMRHTFVTTMLDAGVSLRDVQIAARHADPRTTIRYDRGRANLDRHGNYVLAAYMGGAA
jgi:integrase/recombinase XerD